MPNFRSRHTGRPSPVAKNRTAPLRWPGRAATRLFGAFLTSLIGLVGIGVVGVVRAQDGSSRYTLTVRVAGEPVEWAAEAPATREGTALLVPAGAERARVTFAGGWLELAVNDLGLFDYAHVVAVTVHPTGNGSYRFDATVRHRDEGWEHYADVWRVVGEGVRNGERILLHPHDNEQPFTRSQSGVIAAGVVRVEAGDTVHGLGGSTITLDLDAIFADDPSRTFSVSYEVSPAN